jgi:undecaprenyl-diphosphatase
MSSTGVSSPNRLSPATDRRSPQRRFLVASAGFLALAALAAFAHGFLLGIDAPLSELARGAAVADVFRRISTIGATETALVVGAAVTLASWNRCRLFALVFPLTLIAGAVLNVVMKVLIDRPRPPDPGSGVALASFPSGHTFQATILLGLLPLAVLVMTRRRSISHVAMAVAAIGIGAVGLSRVYLGAHWPLDVVGGILAGLALVQAAHYAFFRWHRADTCACKLVAPIAP